MSSPRRGLQSARKGEFILSYARSICLGRPMPQDWAITVTEFGIPLLQSSPRESFAGRRSATFGTIREPA
jgi:hypothetical protein